MKTTIVCAWCNGVVQWGDNPTADFAYGKVSHGICRKCEIKMEKEIINLKKEVL